MQTVWDLVWLAAERTPKASAVVDRLSGRRLSYAELIDSAEAFAAGLMELGIQPGQRVATVMPNSVDHVIALLGFARLNTLTFLINPRLKPSEVRQLVARDAIELVITSGDLALLTELTAAPGVSLISSGASPQVAGARRLDEVRGDVQRVGPPARPAPMDPAYVFYTSGTTGTPKAVLTPHRATEPRFLFMCTQCGLRHGEHNRLIGLMPLAHNVGFYAVMLAALALNGTYYPLAGASPSVILDVIEEEQISCIFASPTHFHSLVSDPSFRKARVASVASAIYAGATMAGPLLDRVAEGFSAEMTQIYGTTECMNSLYMPSPRGRPQALKASFHSRVRIGRVGGAINDFASPGEEGEILIDTSSDATFLEYLGQPQVMRTKVEAGWYRSGDAGCMDEAGQITYRGRLDDAIVSGAEVIYPIEIEEVLGRFPGVRDVAVIGAADEKWGEAVVAVVAADGQLREESLDALCRMSSLADFKRPRRYVFVDELPRNATGKVARDQLKLLVAREPSAGAEKRARL